MTSFKIQDCVAFVTGTNKPNGIGRAIVEALIAGGASKVYATARDATQLNELVSKHNGIVVAVSLDVTDLVAIEALSTTYPDVTLLVNNAGYATYTSTLDDIEDSMKMIQVNYIAPMAIGKSFSKIFSNAASESKSDENVTSTAIVNINSIASYVSFPIAGTYSATKAGAHSITQSQRRDFAPFHTLVIGVYPGPVDTDMAEDVPFDKVSASVVGDAILDALRTRTEDVFPDPMSKHLHEQWKSDAKALEQYMTASTAVVEQTEIEV